MLIESFSGIRGIWQTSLTPQVVIRYADAFTSVTKAKSLIIGRDTRESSEAIKNLIKTAWPDAADIGVCPTPIVENEVRAKKAEGGVIITASHNPPEHNGLKFLSKDGSVLDPDTMSKVIECSRGIKSDSKIKEGLFKRFGQSSKESHESAIVHYADFIREQVHGISKIKAAGLKILLDPNGGAGIIYGSVLDRLGISYDMINDKPGIFSHPIEPCKENLSGLLEQAKGYDIAAGFDCDADRAELAAPGIFIPGDYVLAIAVDEILSYHDKSCVPPVVINDATSGVVHEIAKIHGAEVIEVEVGEINVVSEMLRRNSLIGGEGSSAGVILSPSRCRDGLITLLLAASAIARRKERISEIVASMPRYTTLSKKVSLSSSSMEAVRKDILAHFKGNKIQATGGADGGIKVIFEDNSFLWFRQSKTEPNIMRIISDSKEEEKAHYMLKEAMDILNN